MDSSMFFSKVLMLIFMVIFCNKVYGSRILDVQNYGVAKNDIDANSLLDSWKKACQSGGTVSVPEGTYVIDPVQFSGPCKGQVTFQLDGTLQAPFGKIDAQAWIKFSDVDGLIIQGSGTLDGRGESAWSDHCTGCPPLTTSLTLNNVNNGHIQHITSLNSKGYHIKIKNGGGTTIEHVTITAPGDSPNTDGIHTSATSNINILNSNIGTGDDCISMGGGSQNINIKGINCGPGHGISIGSIGKITNDSSVSGIHVSGCTMTNTQNGVRIKTYTSACAATVSNVTFQDITVDQSKYPIIIDQNYCGGHQTCSGNSHVKVSKVKFIDVKGTSASPVAVKLQCSSEMPCEEIELDTINLSLVSGGKATSSCSNANVTYNGPQNPPPCSNSLHHLHL
ncbi:Exopolygalacturonase [Heracleum sosnowskyi]|uniref:Exopolygalacturonase n=1 Tax=Heracleum sosnowskyi TaxID=360622 RepID=A0AAD8MX92_9APIA|nr:Exopolygalacturonase [Heracleum sosnowskyi]